MATGNRFDDVLALSRAQRDLPSPRDRRLRREAARVSQQAVADAVGASRESVAKWERGTRRPRGRRLVRYVSLLDVLAAETAARRKPA